jgi:hypothetical protein
MGSLCRGAKAELLPPKCAAFVNHKKIAPYCAYVWTFAVEYGWVLENEKYIPFMMTEIPFMSCQHPK